MFPQAGISVQTRTTGCEQLFRMIRDKNRRNKISFSTEGAAGLAVVLTAEKNKTELRFNEYEQWKEKFERKSPKQGFSWMVRKASVSPWKRKWAHLITKKPSLGPVNILQVDPVKKHSQGKKVREST